MIARTRHIARRHRAPAAAAALLGLSCVAGLGARLGSAPAGEVVVCRKLEAPIRIALRPVEARTQQGFYRVELDVEADADLQDVRLHTLLPAGGRLLQGRAATRALPGGRLARDELLIGAEPGAGVVLIVSVEARAGDAQLAQSAELWLGPVRPAALEGTERTDGLGRSFFEVPAGSSLEAGR